MYLPMKNRTFCLGICLCVDGLQIRTQDASAEDLVALLHSLFRLWKNIVFNYLINFSNFFYSWFQWRLLVFLIDDDAL